MENAAIADRLDAFAALLDLAEANPYQPRAYRRAAETVRTAPVPVAELVRTKRVRKLRGIGPGIEARLVELVTTGEIAELRELERELVPGLVGLGRSLGLTTKRSLELARALEVRTPAEFRAAVEAGRLQSVPGVGPKFEARIVEALAREPAPPRGLLLGQARALVGAIADALGGEPAGDTRRWRDSCEQLAVVCVEDDSLLERFAALPQIVAVIDDSARPDDRGRADRAGGRAAGGVRHRAAARHRLGRVRGGARAAPARRVRARGVRAARPALAPARAARGALHRHAPGAPGGVRHPRRPAHAHDLERRPLQRRGDGPRGS